MHNFGGASAEKGCYRNVNIARLTNVVAYNRRKFTTFITQRGREFTLSDERSDVVAG